jgi:hypothetical protein
MVLCRQTIRDEATGRKYTAGCNYQLDQETLRRLQKEFSGAFVLVEKGRVRNKMIEFAEKTN